MSLKITENDEILKKVKCDQCRQCLTVPPVQISATGKNICGRCKVPSGIKFHVNVPYETLAKMCKFPCKNYPTNCKKKELQFNQVSDHETSCDRKLSGAPCPYVILQGDYFFECDWKGSLVDLEDHFKNFHQDLFLIKNEFKVDITGSNIHTHVLKFNKKLFVICVRFIAFSKSLTIALMIVGKSSESMLYSWQIKVYEDDSSPIATSQETTVQLLEKGNTILETFQKTYNYDLTDCTLQSKQSVVCKIIIKKNEEISVKNVEKMKINPSVGGPALANSTKEGETSKSKQNLMANVSERDRELLKELECPICFNYMRPPIFICSTGHSFCKTCLESLLVCPICCNSISGARNFTLEKLTLKVPFPCKYKDCGCIEHALVDEITAHESQCEFGKIFCPFNNINCKIKGTHEELIKHIKESHKSNFLTINQKIATHNKKIKVSSYAMEFDEKMFIFSIKCNGAATTVSSVHMNVVYFGIKAPAKYQFEVQFCDLSDRKLKLDISQVVKPISDINKCTNNGLTINSELLEPFITENMLHYKVLIKKQ